MAQATLDHQQIRLLAALFTRSHINGRRRRYAEGYTMSELDGVTLNQSDIWISYRALAARGLVTFQTIEHNLVLKLTAKGDEYCRTRIYPELFAPGSASVETVETIGPEPVPLDLRFARDMTIDQIATMLEGQPELAERLATVVPADSNIAESQRDPVRAALMRASEAVEHMGLPNSVAAQAKTHLSIVMLYTDAPTASKKDMGQHLTLACTLVGAATSVGALVVAILAYLASK